MRVVIDTNVVISRFIKPEGTIKEVFESVEQQVFDLVVSEAILKEYQAALLYPHIQKRHGLTRDQIYEEIDYLKDLAILVSPTQSLDIIKQDASDNKFIECAAAGGAEYIVSGDRHLLDIGEYQGIQILSPSQFLAVLKEEVVA